MFLFFVNSVLSDCASDPAVAEVDLEKISSDSGFDPFIIEGWFIDSVESFLSKENFRIDEFDASVEVLDSTEVVEGVGLNAVNPLKPEKTGGFVFSSVDGFDRKEKG